MLTLYLTSLLMPIHLVQRSLIVLDWFRRIDITSTSLIRMSGYYVSITLHIISLVHILPIFILLNFKSFILNTVYSVPIIF